MDDEGQVNLLEDLEELLKLAKDREFHDFDNNKFAAPKMELYNRLIELSEHVKEGRYDN